MNDKCLFIINPYSGSYNRLYFETIIKSFIFNYRIVETLSVNDIEPVLKKYHDYLPILVGGDGTILSALPILIKHNKPFSVFPAGTSNVLCKELKISCNLKEYLFKLIYEPVNYKMDVIQANNKYFLSMCGIGWDAEVVKSVNSKGKKIVKLFNYIFQGLKAGLTYKPDLITLTFNNVKDKYDLLIIGNCKKYAGNFNLFYKAENNDGKMDIIGFKKWNFIIAVITAISIILNKLDKLNKYFDYYQTDSCIINYENNKTPVQLDGDYCPEQLHNFKVLKQHITIVT